MVVDTLWSLAEDAEQGGRWAQGSLTRAGGGRRARMAVSDALRLALLSRFLCEALYQAAGTHYYHAQ